MSKQHLKHLFLLLLSAGIFYACLQSDLFEDQVSLPPEIAAAKAWYETKIGGNSLYWRVGERSGMLEADWRNASADNDANFRIIEVPLGGHQQFYRICPEAFERIMNTGDKRYLASEMRLLIRICEKTNEKDAHVMVVSPDLEYLSQNLDNPLQNFTYLSHGEEFSGLVLFHDLTGTLVDGYQVTGGKFFRIRPPNQPHLRGGCYIIVHWIDWYVNGTFQHSQFVGIGFECYSRDDGGGIGGGFDMSGPGGGGGPGGNTNPPPPPPPNADRIFRNPDARIQQQFNEILRDCMGEALVRELANRLGSNRLNLKFGSGNSYYHPSTGTIEIGALASGTPFVLHELLHALQHMRYSTPAAYDANRLNHEIEAQLAQYMFVRRNAQGSSIGFWNTHYNSRPELRSIVQLAEYVDRHGNATNAARFNTEVRNAVSLFQETSLYRNLRFNPNMSMNDMFANLRRLSAGC